MSPCLVLVAARLLREPQCPSLLYGWDGSLCAAYYNIHNDESALESCNKAIASDPKMADSYFVKASVLYSQGKLEQGRFTAPPEATEALNKYLELDPDGPHAANAREMLQHIGAEVETTYKSRKKSK